MTSPLSINATCPPINELPDAGNIAGVPLDVPTYIVPAQEALYEAATTCCGANPVSLAEGCYFWCEQPASYPGLADWLDCLRSGAPNGTKLSIVGEHESGATRLRTGAPATMAMVAIALLAGSACTWL